MQDGKRQSRKSPFVYVRCRCPICSAENENRYLKTKLYEIQEVELDGRILKIRWLDSDFAGIRPQDYLIWVCFKCFFADVRESFDNPDTLWRVIEFLKESLAAARKRQPDIMAHLGKRIDYSAEVISPESALFAHLLAIFCQEVLPDRSRDVEKLGRFYLRTAWLWEDMEKGEIHIRPSAIEILRSLTSVWSGIPLDIKRSLSGAVHYYERAYQQLSDDADFKKEINLLLLLSSLHAALGNLEAAHQNIKGAFNVALKAKTVLSRKLDLALYDDKVRSAQIEQIKSQLVWLSKAVEKAKDFRERILEAQS